jgi:hypothetical protein
MSIFRENHINQDKRWIDKESERILDRGTEKQQCHDFHVVHGISGAYFVFLLHFRICTNIMFTLQFNICQLYIRQKTDSQNIHEAQKTNPPLNQ